VSKGGIPAKSLEHNRELVRPLIEIAAQDVVAAWIGMLGVSSLRSRYCDLTALVSSTLIVSLEAIFDHAQRLSIG
jgi:hypothetical protein